jgi:hypothetical protein
MNDLEQWHRANDQYLATALGGLRQRLERLGAAEPIQVITPQAPPPPAADPPQQRSLWGRLFKSRSAATPPTLIVNRKPPTAATAPASAALPLPLAMPETDVAQQPPPALVLLARRLGLSEFERLTLLLCAAMELDIGTGELCGRAQHDSTKRYPTFALALTLFDQPAWEVMSPERPLRYWRLIEINQPGAQPLIASALKADERIVNYIKGLNYLDDRLSPLVAPVAVDRGTLPPSQLAVTEAIISDLQRPATDAQLPMFQLLGPDSASKLMVAQQAADRLGMTLYRLPADALPAQIGDHETFARLWRRESALLPIALYIDAAELDRASSPQGAAIQRLLMRGIGVAFLDTREPWPDLRENTLLIDIAKPTPVEQQAAWVEALGDAASDQPARLAGHFNFNVSSIRQIAVHAQAATIDDSGKLGDALWSACLRHSRPALDQLAQALDPKATWEDLELPATEKALLRQIAEQVENRMAVYDGWGFRERMNRGLGISVLFVGDSGTGKTMAAEVIANELRLALYRIDLSAVVSKYIGETEKNLRKLFNAAEHGGAILFFDEADALFGKRSEVKDSHDRYANIEINYLLQRMEAYTGLAILATNMKSALDPAFVRRLRFIVNFPFPGPAERMAIWQKVFPPETPVSGVDFSRVAKLNLTGGSIRNIALNAAFRAARAGTSVTMQLVLEAARTEFRKLERPINEADFRWLETAGRGA